MSMKNCIIQIVGFFYNRMKSCSIQKRYNSYKKMYRIPDSFLFNGEGILMGGDGEIRIGENSYIGRHSLLQASEGYHIFIGKGCKIGPFFQVWTDSANADDDYSGEITSKCGNIEIGNYVWIGSGVLISPGIKIGDSSIIGTNSVVTKDVPAYVIVGGVPARLIRWKGCIKKELEKSGDK